MTLVWLYSSLYNALYPSSWGLFLFEIATTVLFILPVTYWTPKCNVSICTLTISIFNFIQFPAILPVWIHYKEIPPREGSKLSFSSYMCVVKLYKYTVTIAFSMRLVEGKSRANTKSEKYLYKPLSLHVQTSLHSTVEWHHNKILVVFKFGSARANRQTTKLNSPPNFPAIQYNKICQSG